MWIVFALLTPVFWSFVHVMDSHCVDEVFEKPWMGMVVGALTSTIILLLTPFVLPSLLSSPPEIKYIGLSLLAGCFIQFSQFFYFKALAHSEAGIVAAYWNLTPAILPLASFIILRDVLQVNEYAGIAILIFGSVIFCLLDSNFKTRWQTFFLMLVASALQVAALMIEDTVFDHMSYLNGFFFNTLGLILMGLSPLLIKHVRQTFARNFHKLRGSMHLFFGIELLNLFALSTSQRAISLGNPSLVAAVETTVPAYTFLLSIFFLKFYPKFGDAESKHRFIEKLALVILMALGVLLLSQG